MARYDKHAMARRRFDDGLDTCGRDDFARQVLERAEWPLTEDGKASMADKGDDATSVAYQAIKAVLDLGQGAGMNPLQLVRLALRGHNAMQDDNVPELMETIAFIDGLLDRADARAASEAKDDR